MLSKKSEQQYIRVKGARVHNLKNLSVEIPVNSFTVVTGLSGSGKSSLAFDTLYAEGRRRYVESLSSYARQFLGRLDKPEVDFIDGIPPAIAIEQKVNTANPRSTVGTSTEIYDYLKLLYARIGVTFSPVSGQRVKRHTVTDVVDFIAALPSETKVIIIAPVQKPEERTAKQYFEVLLQQGYSRIINNANETVSLEELLENNAFTQEFAEVKLIIDRVKATTDSEQLERIADSVQTAFFESKGICMLLIQKGEESDLVTFSNKFEADGIIFDEPDVHMFSFNNPVGACRTCEGYGSTIGIDEDLVVPDKSLSIFQEAVACWRGEKMSMWKDKLVYSADKFDFPIHKPYSQLSEAQKELLWRGNKYFQGLTDFFEMLENEKHKIQYRVMISRYRGKTVCPECKGSRLRKEVAYVKVAGKSISELVLMPISDLLVFFDQMQLGEHDFNVAKRIFIEIKSRLHFLNDVGLGYLTLNRLSSTLSGGESQRINLATSLGSSLTGSLYILDEPSIGLHSRDTDRLIKVLRALHKGGNTVLVVEHDEEVIRAADYVMDIGPEAGRGGGNLVFMGSHAELLKAQGSLTADYLTGKRTIEVPTKRRKARNFIKVNGARENNLKNLSVSFPLNVLCAVTGVSGSGKSTLVRNILYAAVSKHVNNYGEITGKFDSITGDLKLLDDVQFVDQNPIGKSSRSNPVTYIKAYDEIRKLYSEQPESKRNGYTPAHFSFNVEGGRCETCQGDGTVKVEMQFMADVVLECETCKGKRFKDDVLEVSYRSKNIYDILQLTVDEAMEFFAQAKGTTERKIVEKMKPLADVGLGYVQLGQASGTLSGGESQRIKLAYFLSKESKAKSGLFIFDEPTTGLHFHDIHKLLKAINALIDRGHSVVVIEHNAEIIKSADWIIDLGPDGGTNGGKLIFEGTPEQIILEPKSFTGEFLKTKLIST